MPKIDPRTGCTVMTFQEFLASEAAAEGKEPHEIMQEIVHVFDDDCAIQRERFRKDALEILKQDEETEYHPAELVEVLTTNYDQGFGGHSGGFTARVRCTDGVTRFAVYGEYSDSGSYDSPGYGESEVKYYPDPVVLTRGGRVTLEKLVSEFVHYDRWYKEDGREELEQKGCVGYDHGRMIPSTIGRLVLGLSLQEE